ncbi:MAG: hypothetical protein ACTSQI_12665 [Candidatus Helarchaeota archaeon]
MKIHLYEFLNSIHWNTLYQLEIEALETLPTMLEAFIDTTNWVIHFQFYTKFSEIFYSLLSENGFADSGETPHLLGKGSSELINLQKLTPYPANYHILLRDLLAGIALHEYGHSTICPIQNENFSVLVQAVSTALEQENKYHPKVLSFVLNLFSDTIINTTLGLEEDKTFFRNAQFMFYYANLLLHGTENTLFGFFILLNIKLFQFHPPIRKRLQDTIILNMLTDYKEILKPLMEIFCPFPEILEKMWNGVSLDDSERWKVINRINKTLDWDEMAYTFTKLIKDYLPDPSELDHPLVPDTTFTKKFKEDPKFKADIMEKILKRKLQKKRRSPSSKLATKHTKAQKKSSGKKGPKGYITSPKPKTAPNSSHAKRGHFLDEKYPGESNLEAGFASITPLDFLKILYQVRIKELDIKLPRTRQGQNLPIGWMNRQILTEKDNPLEFDPLMIYYLPQSDELLLYKKAIPFTSNVYGTAREQKFPNLAIFCDDSGSMDWNPLEGTGDYDAVIIMLFSLFNWLDTHHFAASIKYNITNFSSTTRSSGWLDYYHLQDVLPQIFTPEQGGTVLDLDIFQQIIAHPEKKVVILLTDGAIANADKIKAVLKRNRTNIDFMFIQIGTLSSLAKDLDRAGFSLVQIKDISKLRTIVLDFVKKAFHESF